jgi:hypothetical protein
MSKSTRTGGCECGALRYELTADPIATAMCHCTQCQTQSGSAFSMTQVVPADGFAFTRGEPKLYTGKSDGGADKQMFFCGTCGVRICNRLSSRPATVNLKPGTLDDPSEAVPVVAVWTSSKQPWSPLPEGIRQFEKNPG